MRSRSKVVFVYVCVAYKHYVVFLVGMWLIQLNSASPSDVSLDLDRVYCLVHLQRVDVLRRRSDLVFVLLSVGRI